MLLFLSSVIRVLKLLLPRKQTALVCVQGKLLTAVTSYFINYVTDTRQGTSNAKASQFLAGAQGAFAVGRFAGVGLMNCFKPRAVFGVYLTLCMVFIAPTITQRGNTGLALLYVTLFFESICFPTIVALGMRGLGRHTKRGSGYIIAGVLGGAVVPSLTGHVADMHSTATSMVVPLCFFFGAWSYALAVNFVCHGTKTPLMRMPSLKLAWGRPLLMLKM